MKRAMVTRLLAAAILILTTGVPMETTTAASELTLSQVIHRARYPRQRVQFHPPSTPQFETLRMAAKNVEKYADDCNPEAARRINDLLAPAAMELLVLKRGAATFWIIKEKEPVYRGSGIYIRRCGAHTEPLVVQAPHGYYDLHTGRIARQVFRDTGARWLMLNSLQRYKSRKGETPSDAFHPADAAHNHRLLFQAVTKGILEASPSILFAQLHGFEERSHGVDAILSDGRRSPQTWSARLATAWKPPGLRVEVYGANGRGLGGTTNVQGNLINAAGGRFLHVEMTTAVRERMKKKDEFRKTLSAALVKVARETR